MDRLLGEAALEPVGRAIAIGAAVAGSASADLGRPRVSRLKEREVGALLALLSAITLCEAGARGQAHGYGIYGGQLRFESQRFTRISPGR